MTASEQLRVPLAEWRKFSLRGEATADMAALCGLCIKRYYVGDPIAYLRWGDGDDEYSRVHVMCGKQAMAYRDRQLEEEAKAMQAKAVDERDRLLREWRALFARLADAHVAVVRAQAGGAAIDANGVHAALVDDAVALLRGDLWP